MVLLFVWGQENTYYVTNLPLTPTQGHNGLLANGKVFDAAAPSALINIAALFTKPYINIKEKD